MSDQLYAEKAINVYSGRWRRNLERAVDGDLGDTCLRLLRMVDLLP